MKKIYSFALMAAMLLLGTNVWAETIDVEEASELAGAIATAHDGDVISVSTGLSITDQLVLNANKHITLDLNGGLLTMNNGKNPAILVSEGVLTIQNGTIQNIHTGSTDLIRVVGTTATGYDAANGIVYSQAIVESNATIKNLTQSGTNKYNALTITENATKLDGKSYSNGARIDAKGKLYATTYCIKVNGTIQKPANVVDAPYVHIHGTAELHSNDNAKAVAAYCAGYAKWLIEGLCEGATGVYVKSGDVDIHGATVSSNYTGTYDPVDNVSSTSGVTGAGSAVAVESNQNYSGAIDVTINGGATLTAGTGFALEENVSNNAGNVSAEDVKVEAVTVEDASFQTSTTESSAGAISISATTTEVAVAAAQDEGAKDIIVVTSATIEGSITFNGAETGTGTEEHPVTLNDLVTTSAVIPAQDDKPTIVVPLDIKLTNDGFASFSAPIDLYKATGKTGYAAFGIYTGTYNATLNELELHEVDYVQAGKGVILYRDPEASTAHCFFTTSGTPSAYQSNDLKASADWVVNGNHDQIYCLRNVGGVTMFYQYVGAEMPANKAYLDLSEINSGAPQRIRMVIAQEEQTEAIESVEAASVKAVKFVENGEILIRRGENVYNLQGQIVK